MITEHRRPLFNIEAKWSDEPITRGLRYLNARFPDAKTYQISAVGKKDYRTPDDIRVCPALDFLGGLV